eukprot:15270043-Alexandrium_andersonii.AAC.1
MSASLVGSEMCIRDRDFRRMTVLPFSSSAGCFALGAAVARSVWALSTVSYTHLTLPTICSV